MPFFEAGIKHEKKQFLLNLQDVDKYLTNVFLSINIENREENNPVNRYRGDRNAGRKREKGYCAEAGIPDGLPKREMHHI